MLELTVGAIGAGVAARVADEAVRQSLDEHRPVPRAGMRDGALGGLTHGPDAHPVDRLRRNAHDLRTSPDLARRHRPERRVLAVPVVLADENERQLEDLAEVEALEDVALVHRAVAEVRDRDPTGRPLERKRRPRRRRDAAADDPERADEAIVG